MTHKDFPTLNALSEFDYGMMDEEEKEIYRQIKLMTLYIIHIGVKEIYTTNFYAEEDTSSSS